MNRLISSDVFSSVFVVIIFVPDSCYYFARQIRKVAPTATKTILGSKRGTSLSIFFLGRSLFCFFQIGGEAIERAFPEFAIFFYPFRGLLQWLRVQLHFVNASITAPSQQSGFLEHAQMF